MSTTQALTPRRQVSSTVFGGKRSSRRRSLPRKRLARSSRWPPRTTRRRSPRARRRMSSRGTRPRLRFAAAFLGSSAVCVCVLAARACQPPLSPPLPTVLAGSGRPAHAWPSAAPGGFPRWRCASKQPDDHPVHSCWAKVSLPVDVSSCLSFCFNRVRLPLVHSLLFLPPPPHSTAPRLHWRRAKSCAWHRAHPAPSTFLVFSGISSAMAGRPQRCKR